MQAIYHAETDKKKTHSAESFSSQPCVFELITDTRISPSAAVMPAAPTPQATSSNRIQAGSSGRLSGMGSLGSGELEADTLLETGRPKEMLSMRRTTSTQQVRAQERGAGSPDTFCDCLCFHAGRTQHFLKLCLKTVHERQVGGLVPVLMVQNGPIVRPLSKHGR